MKSLLLGQYEMVTFSRSKLIAYLKTLRTEDFLLDRTYTGRGSIRDLIVHICDTYMGWIGERALKYETYTKPFSDYKHMDDCVNYFNLVDDYLAQFIAKFGDEPETPIAIIKNGEKLMVSPLRLFTHVITHEFHHKGQIMSLSRQLNYTPVDADIIQ